MRVVDSGLVCAALSSHNRVNLCCPTISVNGTFKSGQPLPTADGDLGSVRSLGFGRTSKGRLGNASAASRNPSPFMSNPKAEHSSKPRRQPYSSNQIPAHTREWSIGPRERTSDSPPPMPLQRLIKFKPDHSTDQFMPQPNTRTENSMPGELYKALSPPECVVFPPNVFTGAHFRQA